MKVRLLDPVTVDRIAAGEVVERPASVVKELVENALDADATRIEIVIEDGGRRLIRVIDNGAGMSAEDLALAVERHATSKLPDGDLSNITTLGFRGEALPSIGSVAKLRVVSRPAGAPQGFEIGVEGGQVGAVRPAAHPPGTTIEVRDLFYNVPARRKFVRSDATEIGHIQRWVERLALSRPDVAFRLSNGGRLLLDAPALAAGEDPVRRVDAVLGAGFLERALRVEHAAGPVAVDGWIGAPTAARAQADAQYWFVNDRHVRDRLLMSAVRLGFRDVLYHGRHPAYLLHLTIDPRLVDVNAHPAKLEVRFRDSRQVHDFVFRAVERTLGATRPGSTSAAHGATAAPAGMPAAVDGAPPRAVSAPTMDPLPFAQGPAPPAIPWSASPWAVAEAATSGAATEPLGTAIAPLAAHDPRRGRRRASPTLVVPLDR